MLDRDLIFLDLETTGANASFDRITEIGVVEVSAAGEVTEWSTLVNPEMRIPPMIERLTGINNDMVAQAPTFAALADSLFERLQGKLLIAHNARFDYGFLRNSFKRLGTRYQTPVLCTVKLSRRMFPQHHRHNLDTLISRHGISVSERHRALADARAIHQFVGLCAAEAPERLRQIVDELLKAPAMPLGVAEDVIDAIPEAPGVYLFYGEGSVMLYVGKSVGLRSRVMSHFSGDHRAHKDMRISQQITRVDWIETAGELGALLLEARLIKQLQPVHNRRLRDNRELCAFALQENAEGLLVPQVQYAHDLDLRNTANIYGRFKSRREGLKVLESFADSFQLCRRALGIEPARSGPCFAYQLKRCRGLCCGKESPVAHNLRLTTALSRMRWASWPYAGPVGFVEEDPTRDRVDIHVFDRWCHLGSVRDASEIDELLANPQPSFDMDTYQIMQGFLAKYQAQMKVLRLG